MRGGLRARRIGVRPCGVGTPSRRISARVHDPGRRLEVASRRSQTSLSSAAELAGGDRRRRAGGRSGRAGQGGPDRAGFAGAPEIRRRSARAGSRRPRSSRWAVPSTGGLDPSPCVGRRGDRIATDGRETPPMAAASGCGPRGLAGIPNDVRRPDVARVQVGRVTGPGRRTATTVARTSPLDPRSSGAPRVGTIPAPKVADPRPAEPMADARARRRTARPRGTPPDVLRASRPALLRRRRRAGLD